MLSLWQLSLQTKDSLFYYSFGWSLWNQRQGVWSLNDHTRFYSTLSKLITTKIIYIQLEFAINESYFLANWTVPCHKMYCCRPTVRYWGIYCRMKTIPNLCYNTNRIPFHSNTLLYHIWIHIVVSIKS